MNSLWALFLVPLIGNVAEHLVAVQVALKNQMDLSLSIALGSSLQIALFVAPILVFISLLMGNPMTLEFNHPELIAMVAASVIAALVAIDGRSNWLEGAMLIAVFLMLAIGFFFLPRRSGRFLRSSRSTQLLCDHESRYVIRDNVGLALLHNASRGIHHGR